MTRGLRLKRSDRDTLAHQLIHQCALSHIGVAYDIYKSCLMFHVFFI